MKNTLYTVPEGFFDKIQTEAESGAHKIRTRRYAITTSIAGMLGIAALVFSFSLKSPENQVIDQVNYLAAEYSLDQEIIDDYEADVFLNIFEY